MKRFKTTSILLLLTTILISWKPTQDIQTSANWKDKIVPNLWQEAQQSSKPVDVFVLLKEQAEVEVVARTIQVKEAKAAYVFKQLQQQAAQTQIRLLQLLEDETPSNYRAYWIVNGVLTKADAQLLEKMAQLEEVKALMPDPWVALEQPTRVASGSAKTDVGLEWGLDMMDVELVWERGIRGAGVVVGGQDTGYNWEHEALQGSYKGWDGANTDHNYHWHDAIHDLNTLHDDGTGNLGSNPCGLDVTAPCDDVFHGTHTMGTITGIVNDTLKIGVAPDAKWIGCRNMDRGWGKPSTYIECLEWFLAPTDINNENPDPSKAPHVINNSWGCPEQEGCFPSNFEVMEMAVNNLRAAGTVVVVSAGNSGRDGCYTVSSPPAIFKHSFTVGATNSQDSIAKFSSLGPVNVDESFRMKPNIAAPGVGVLSAINSSNDGYARYSGTSMAGPHIAGLVALMISARPDLAGQVDAIEHLIMETAVTKYGSDLCEFTVSEQVPNNTYGYGRANAARVINKLLDPSDNPNGEVTVYPNPFQSYFLVELPSTIEAEQILLYDINGHLIYEKTIPENQSLLSLSLAHLSSGVYFYRIKGANDTLKGKVLKM